MGKRITWFDMVSKREKKRQEEEYNNMIFPFGLKQKDEELRLLKELIVDKKPEDSLYQVVLLKEIFLNNISNNKEISYADCLSCDKVQEDLNDWQKGALASKFTKEEKENLKIFSWKIIHIDKFDDFPKQSIKEWINH